MRLRLILTIFLLSSSLSAHAQIQGLGQSYPGNGKALSPNGTTGACLDKDGDGYGVGPGCLGPDADDNDPNVHSISDVQRLYGPDTGSSTTTRPIEQWLAHLGYETQTISGSSVIPCVIGGTCSSLTGTDAVKFWVVDANNGSDSNTCSTNGSSILTVEDIINGTGGVGPCQTYDHITASVASCNIVVFRAGTYSNSGGFEGELQPASGNLGSTGCQTVYIAYPGEVVTLTNTNTPGANVIDASATSGSEKNYFVFDGFKVTAGCSAGGKAVNVGSDGGDAQVNSTNWTFRHDEFYDSAGASGNADSNFSGDNIANVLIEEDVFHDVCNSSEAQHNLYLGSNGLASYAVVIRRNILYNDPNSFPEFQFNGRCNQGGPLGANSCWFSQNLVYSGADGSQGISLEMGWDYSYVVGNVVFSTSNAIVLDNYASSQCVGGTYTPADGRICAYNESHNVFANNTLVPSSLDYNGASQNNIGVVVNNTTSTTAHCGSGSFFVSTYCGDMGENTYVNNIIAAGCATCNAGGTLPQVEYYIPEYLSTDTWEYDQLYNLEDPSSTNTIVYSGTSRTFAQWQAGTSIPAGCTSGCLNSSPSFVAWSRSNNASPQLNVFYPASGSPALNAGTASGLPQNCGNAALTTCDIYGKVVWGKSTSAPSLGAIERLGYQQGWSQLVGTAQVPGYISGSQAPAPGQWNACPLNGQAGSLDKNNDPYDYAVTSSGSDSACTASYLDWSGGVGRTKSGSEELVHWGGGHLDYGGNEVYAVTLNQQPAIRVRLTPPSFLNGSTQYNTACTAPPYLNNDGTAATRHTYFGLAYIPSMAAAYGDSMWVFKGGLYGGNGCNAKDTEDFKFSTLAWTNVDPGTSPSGSLYGSGGSGGSPVQTVNYDTGNGEIAYSDNSDLSNQLELYLYSLSGNSFGSGTNPSTYTDNQTFFWDPVNNLQWQIGEDPFGTFQVYALNVSTSTSTSYTSTTGTACEAIDPSWASDGLGSYGAAFDTKSGVDEAIIYPINGGNTVFLFNPATAIAGSATCASDTFSGGPPTTATVTNGGYGIYGRMAYFPTLNIAAVDQAPEGDVYAFCLDSGGCDLGFPSPPASTGGSSMSGGVSITGGVTIQ